MTNAHLQPIYIVGPTASGKSELALRLARELGGVIISADSMQIYRGLDIGTAKVSKRLRDEIPHKMIDIVGYDEEFSVAEFATLAQAEISSAISDGKFPIVVGGTGLYFEALIYPLSFASTTKNAALRSYLEAFLQQNGQAALHGMLAFFDSDSADRLNQNDSKRVIRALEIALTTGKPMAQSSDSRRPTSQNIIMIGLNCDRQELYRRINARVDEMFDSGLVDEALSVGSFAYQSMQAIGFKEFSALTFDDIGGKMTPNAQSLAHIKELIKQHTRNYAKRQITWFKRYDFAKWFDISDLDAAVSYVKTALNAGIQHK